MTIEEEQVDQVTEEVTETEPQPTLKITSSWPAEDGRVETLELALNMPVEDLTGDEPGKAAARCWVMDLATATLRELRGAGQPKVGHLHLFVDRKAVGTDSEDGAR